MRLHSSHLPAARDDISFISYSSLDGLGFTDMILNLTDILHRWISLHPSSFIIRHHPQSGFMLIYFGPREAVPRHPSRGTVHFNMTIEPLLEFK